MESFQTPSALHSMQNSCDERNVWQKVSFGFALDWAALCKGFPSEWRGKPGEAGFFVSRQWLFRRIKYG